MNESEKVWFVWLVSYDRVQPKDELKVGFLCRGGASMTLTVDATR